MDFKGYLEELKIWYRFIDKEETIHTRDAAKAAGVDLNRLTKSLVLLDHDGAPLVAIIPGNAKVDLKKVKKLLGLRKVRLCSFDRAHEYSGYDPGGTPPLGYKVKDIKVVIDQKLMKYKTIYGGGGKRDLLIEINPEDVVKVNAAEVADICKSDIPTS